MTRPNPTANTRDCFSEWIGNYVTGVIFDALPLQRPDLAIGSKALIFDDGRALVIHGNGSFYVAGRLDVEAAVQRKVQELERASGELAEVLRLAGQEASRPS